MNDTCTGCQIRRVHARGFFNIKNLLKLSLHNNKIEELKQVKDIFNFNKIFISFLFHKYAIQGFSPTNIGV